MWKYGYCRCKWLRGDHTGAGQALNPICLCHYKKRRERHTEECHMKVEAEIEVIHLQAEGHQELLATVRS